MSAQFIFTMYKVGRVVPPEREVLKDISLSFYPGAKIGVIGPNGSGKSTLLRIMAGIDDGYTGEARLSPGFTVGMLEQEPKLDESKDVTGNVMDGVAETAKLLTDYDELMAGWADPDADYEALGAQQADLEAKIEAAGAWDLKRTVEIAMDALRLPPGDADVASRASNSGSITLSRHWIERFLADYEGTVVAITHDRYFLDNVASWILELDHGKGMPFEGNYSGWLEQKQARLAKEEKHASTRQRTLERELEWVRMAPKARQAKSKARLAAYDQLLAEQQAAKGASDGLEIYIPPGDRLGDQVIEVDHLTKGFGDKLLIDDLTFSLPKAGIVGVIGPNGAGKTTLFRMLVEAGEQATAAPDAQPDSGEIRVGSTVQMAHVDQHRDHLDGERTVYEEITDGDETIKLGTREMNGRAYCASFNFRGADQQKLVGQLSGGERNRVHLAKLLRTGGNVLLLDEPTNDLDVDTLRALEAGLENFPGCAVVISHDRWFLDRIATHVLAFEGNSQVRWFEGNFSDYEAMRKKELGAEASQPHRIKYKPLTRS